MPTAVESPGVTAINEVISHFDHGAVQPGPDFGPTVSQTVHALPAVQHFGELVSMEVLGIVHPTTDLGIT
jgi:hypothetical protein